MRKGMRGELCPWRQEDGVRTRLLGVLERCWQWAGPWGARAQRQPCHDTPHG